MVSVNTQTEFGHHDVGNLYSIAHLFPRTARCGVYVLTFANGERYVGQSVDVVRRFGNHRRNLGDITSVEFAPCPAKGLNTLELETINRHRADGHRLRNIVHGQGPIGDSDLDPLVVPSEQQAWLNATTPDPVSNAPRVIDETQRDAQLERLGQLQRRMSFPTVVDILRHYIPTCLLRPAETERTFWALSALPSTGQTATSQRLAAISVNKMETLVLYEGWSRDDGYFFEGLVNLSTSVLVATLGDLSEITRLQPHLDVSEATYESAGGDGTRIGFVGADGYDSIWSIPGTIEAARALNVMLMRKGPTFQWRWHSYPLADWAFKDEEELDALWGPRSL